MGRGLADRFIRHALQFSRTTGGKVVMLLDLAGLAHPIRHALWTCTQPARVFILDECVCLPNGQPPRFTAEQRYCWVVWEPGHAGPAATTWLSTRRRTR